MYLADAGGELLLELGAPLALVVELRLEARVHVGELALVEQRLVQLVVDGALAEHVEQLGRLGRDQRRRQHRLDQLVVAVTATGARLLVVRVEDEAALLYERVALLEYLFEAAEVRLQVLVGAPLLIELLCTRHDMTRNRQMSIRFDSIRCEIDANLRAPSL